MKSMWNSWLRQSVFFYTFLYTAATVINSVMYLSRGYYEDPNGNWHELDRAVIVLIVVLAVTMIRHLQLKNYWLKAVAVYVPTLLLALAYVYMVGLRETLAATAYRDIFVNYSIGFVAAAAIGWLITRAKPAEAKK